MDKHKLINLHRIFVYLRNDIQNPQNFEIINSIINSMEDEKNTEFIDLLNGKFEHMDQLVFEDGQIISDSKNVCQYITSMLVMMKDSLAQGNYHLAYDIVDLIHFLPELLINYQGNQLKKYWKNNIKTFSKKWKNDVFKNSKKYFV